MKIVMSNAHHLYPVEFKKLLNDLRTDVISDLNCTSAGYYGTTDFLKAFGLASKRSKTADVYTHRIVGNIEAHTDKGFNEYKQKVYLLVLDVGAGNRYNDSQDMPQLYQDGEFFGLRKGDIIEFNHTRTHGLFWDRRIDIATFWQPS